MLSTSRVDAFTDGVFAIAVTLLVLDLHDPEGPGLWHGLTEQWPSFAAYAVSFATIGIIWLNHNSLFGRLARLDRPIVTLNLLLLLVVSFIPFPTGMLASHLRAGSTDSRVAAAVYGATMTVMGAVFTTIWWQVSKREHLFAEDTTAHHVRAGLQRSLRGPIIYAAATAISVVSAYAALVGYAAVAAYFALPGRTLTATTDDDQPTGEDVPHA